MRAMRAQPRFILYYIEYSFLMYFYKVLKCVCVCVCVCAFVSSSFSVRAHLHLRRLNRAPFAASGAQKLIRARAANNLPRAHKT